MDSIFEALQILTLAIFIHELGHYVLARLYGVTVNRASLFFNPYFTLIKYNPTSGRLSLFSKKVTVNLANSAGASISVLGEKCLLSFQIHRSSAPDSFYNSESNDLEPYQGILFNKTVIKTRTPFYERVWKRTEYCIGWLPFGGYVLLDVSDNEGSITNKAVYKQLLINIAGVVFNLISMVAVLFLLRTVYGNLSIEMSTFLLDFAYYSFGLIWLNILPLPGLDGGNILINIISLFYPVNGRKVIGIIYNLLSWGVFAFIISSWFRPSMAFENHLFDFFNNIFVTVAGWIFSI